MIKSKQKGFTLIEVLIAMSIISLIAMTFFNFLSSTIKYNEKNEKDIQCLNIAQAEVENLREQIKSGEKINFISTSGVNIKLNQSTSEYDISLNEGRRGEYTLKIDLSSIDELYTIRVNVKPKNEYFSRKNVNFETKVFGG